MNDTRDTDLWHFLDKKSMHIQTEMDTLTRKQTGTYYTNLELTDVMMFELVERLKNKNPTKKIYEHRFLEPCVGSGNFVFSYLKAVKATGLNQYDAKILLNNIYVADINTESLKEYKKSLRKVAKFFWEIELSDEYFESHMGGALLVDVTAKELNYIDINQVFPAEVLDCGFDIIATNPPYKNLKAERSHYKSKNEYDKDKTKYLTISQIVSKRFKYSIDGVLNLYKLFVEEIIDRYANETAIISLLIPSSIMSDKTSMKLRTHILNNSKLISVKLIEEGSYYIDAQQSLSAILLQKGELTDKVAIVKDYCNNPKDTAEVKIEDILNKNTGNAIVAISSHEYKLLKKLRSFPIVKEISFITNLRGELDLTANKQYITNTDTGYPLLRGKNIDYYTLSNIPSGEFVMNEFIEMTKKSCYIQQDRIICQQVANMNKERRVTFSLANANCVLGNSCNFISVKDNPYGIDHYALLGLFNTKIINWLFKLTSSNNHVNNYEIDCFPVPLESSELQKISVIVKEFLTKKDETLLDKIEELAYKAYGILDEKIERNHYFSEYVQAIKYILPDITNEEAYNVITDQFNIEILLKNRTSFDINVAKGITTKFKLLYHGFILNHTTFKLSDLDLEMIKYVPQGGNWKDIPMETVAKSKRLKRITETGGRTTLYGRIDYNKPSYTITTYFNRPGNGTYVHPVHERVLTVREAARFQAFKDDYFFYGNKTQHLKQVGNAVPTLLAYQIASKIKEKTGCSKSIDLFCGAGGMTVGFKFAGIHSVLSNDIEESACTTLKINNPEINVLCGDITKIETRETIKNFAISHDADIICGGPPCQGFSMAGYRAEDDPRNQLFREFIDVVKRVNPKVIVFENVQGLLSYQGGKTYREVHSLFAELGYNTEGRSLMSSDYGVPQKRKRVIIICTRNDLPVLPEELFPTPITCEVMNQVTARDTIEDLESVSCDDAKYIELSESTILKFFKSKISYNEYIKLISLKDNVEDIPAEQYEQLCLANM